ncbi:MAG: molybdopterin-dependent oxidoreductase, partial [Rhodospirillales bacterium]|nr:molybdopterin-dependent oxidoreductase [Rhodospirillales bacterium]
MSRSPRGPSHFLNPNRRAFLKGTGGLALGAALGGGAAKALAQPYGGYRPDDQLERIVTSCAHNCGGRHMLVAHRKNGVIVRLSSDDGRESGGLDTPEVPQLRACLRGRAYRARLYSPERLLYPMIRVGARGEGRFKRASWDEALELVAQWITHIKDTHGPTAILDQSYAGASWGVLHKSDQIEGLQGRFLGMFGSRTSSWSVPSYQGSSFAANMSFGTIEDGNEDDAFAHSKLMILWGWNPAYTFHGGNTVWYLRQAKQKGCRFVCVDPQYTDSAQAFDAWWIPIKPGTDAAMMAAMAQVIFAEKLQDQPFIDRFCQGADAGSMPDWAKGQENFKDYILGKYDGQPKTPEWAAPITGVSPDDIRKLARLYATTKPAALKASWAPGRAAYGEQYARMAIALQAITGNVGKLGGSAEGVGKAWPAQAVAYPYDEYANVWYAAIKSDCWARCVLDYPNVSRESIGLWPRGDPWDGFIPNIRAIFWQGSNWLNQLPNVNQALRAIQKLDLVVCLEQTITPSALYADVLLPVCTHFERQDVALPWYKGHYYIHRPKVIRPLGESKTDFQIYTELAYRLGFGERYNPRATRAYFDDPDAVDEAYLEAWWKGRVMATQGVSLGWEDFKRQGVHKFRPTRPHVAFQDQIEKGLPFAT